MSIPPAPTFPENQPSRLLIGTHRRAHRSDPADIAFGIYSAAGSSLDNAGESTLAVETAQPGWLATDKTGQHIYAVNEVRQIEGLDGGAVSAFAMDADGSLRLLNSRALPPMPCHCTLDATGAFLLVATFGGGSVHLFPIEGDGSIGEECDRHNHTGSSAHPKRQTHPHAHAVILSPDNRFVLVPDLGTDRIEIYALDPRECRLRHIPENTVKLPPLSGPRHGVFAPNGRQFFLINEMSATVTLFTWDAETARLDAVQTIELLPEGFDGLKSGAAIEVHPTGRQLYATTRSHGSSGMPDAPGTDLLVWFHVADDGTLVLGGRMPSGGGIPRSFVLTPDTCHLLIGHQCSGTVVEFALLDGVPMLTGRSIATPVPVCLAFCP